MSTPKQPGPFTYRSAAGPGSGRYEVLHQGEVIGTVSRLRLGAGQFGARWVATSDRGKRSTQYATRDAAASWLVEQARR